TLVAVQRHDEAITTSRLDSEPSHRTTRKRCDVLSEHLDAFSFESSSEGLRLLLFELRGQQPAFAERLSRARRQAKQGGCCHHIVATNSADHVEYQTVGLGRIAPRPAADDLCIKQFRADWPGDDDRFDQRLVEALREHSAINDDTDRAGAE